MNEPKKRRADNLKREVENLNAQIQRLINERNAFGLAIDRALSGIVPDEHPLRSRLVEIAAMHAKFETMRKQEPVAWRIFDGEGGYDYCSFDENEQLRDEYIKRNGEQYASWVEPLALCGAQPAPSVPDGWQPIETAPKDGTHVLLANKTGTRVADGMYGNYKVWSWPYVLVEPAYWRPMPAAPGAQESNDV